MYPWGRVPTGRRVSRQQIPNSDDISCNQLEYYPNKFVRYEKGIGDMSKMFLGKFNTSGDKQTMAKGDSGAQKSTR
jgi:hypothetical protein